MLKKLAQSMAIVPAAEMLDEINGLKAQNQRLLNDNRHLLAENARLRLKSGERSPEGNDLFIIDLMNPAGR